MFPIDEYHCLVHQSTLVFTISYERIAFIINFENVIKDILHTSNGNLTPKPMGWDWSFKKGCGILLGLMWDKGKNLYDSKLK